MGSIAAIRRTLALSQLNYQAWLRRNPLMLYRSLPLQTD